MFPSEKRKEKKIKGMLAMHRRSSDSRAIQGERGGGDQSNDVAQSIFLPPDSVARAA